MSGVTAATILAATAVGLSAVGTGYSIYSGMESADRQKSAQADAKAAALKQEGAAAEAQNKANQKKPDISGILASAQQIKGGGSSTMLTGPSGVGAADLNLGKSSLLGG